MIFITWAIHNQSFIVLGCFILELLGVNVYICTIFFWSSADFDKNRTNNWKNPKLCENYYHYLNNLHKKFQYVRLFSLVIRLKSLLNMKVIFKMVPVQSLPLYLKVLFPAPKNAWWLKYLVNIKFLLFTILFAGCSFRFRSAQKYANLSWSKSVNFWLKVEGNKTRQWYSVLLSNNSSESLQVTH